MSDQLDLLIARHLAGTASVDEVRELDELLTREPAARHALVIAAAQDVELAGVFAAEAAQDAVQFMPQPHRSPVKFAAAAAAAMLLAAGSLLLFTDRYPGPAVSGLYRVEGGTKARRGSVIATDAGNGTIALGGYCRVDVGPNSRVEVEGESFAEQVFLAQGFVHCKADRDVGRFTVRTDVGAVSVKGTQFTVQMLDEQEEDEMFDRRMLVAVLTGSVLVSGTWGEQTLRAGQQASLPPPGAALHRALEGFELTDDLQKKLDRILSPSRAAEVRSAYRTAIRGKIFDAVRGRLQASMPATMPGKVMPKVRAIRSKKRAGGPPSSAETALIRLVSQKRARKVLMEALHETADAVSDEAAADDRLIAWLLARKVRGVLPGEMITAFDKAVTDAGIVDSEARFVTKAEAAIDAAIAAYDPDVTGIVDPETGKIIVSEEELGMPVKDDALASRVSQTLNGLLPETVKQSGTDSPALSNADIEAARLAYCTAVRARVFDAARRKQVALLPEKMPSIVETKVMAIRTRARKGGPPSSQDIARIQRAVMQRTRAAMRQQLHAVADAVAVKAARDEKLVAAAAASAIRARLEPAAATAFDTALAKAGMTADESAYVTEAEERIAAAVETIDPDLTGIVDPVTGKVATEH